MFGVLGACVVVTGLRSMTLARRRASFPSWAADWCGLDEYAGAEVRIAPTLEPIAFAVPGPRSYVVISRRIARLPEAHRRSILAHEGAHLKLRHDRYLRVLALYERVWGWLPGVRSVVAAHRRGIEQWADVEATKHPMVDLQSLSAARLALLSAGDAAGEVALSSECPRPFDSGWVSAGQSVGVSVVVVALIVASVYGVGHIVGDLNTAVAALH